MIRIAAMCACVAAAACGPHHWVSLACEVSASPRRDAVVFVDDGALVLRRDDGDHRIAFPACVGDGKHIHGVLALADGWRAVVYGYATHGATWGEAGSVADEFACIVDFHTGAGEPVDLWLVTRDLRHFADTVGANTGWIYTHEGSRPVQVIDVANRKQAILDGAGSTIVELASSVRTVAIESRTLTVQDFDTTTWPPTPSAPRQIAVRVAAEAIALSADGRWAAYAEGHDLGLVDLERGAVAFEQLAGPDVVVLGDVVSTGDHARVLVGTGVKQLRVRWLDEAGAQFGAATESSVEYPHSLWWLPGRSRVAAGSGCDVDLIALPPPAP